MTNLKPCPSCGTEASFQLAAADLIGISVYMLYKAMTDANDLTSENEEKIIAVIGEEGD